MAYQTLAVGVLDLDSGATILPTPLGNAAWRTYCAWLVAGNLPLPYVAPAPPAPTAADLAAQAELDARAALAAALQSNALVANYIKATPAQVDTWIDNNVTDLTSAKVALRALAYVVALLARERLIAA